MYIVKEEKKMSNQAAINREEVQDIKQRFLSGLITYDEARAEAEPVIKRINEAIEVVAKKHNKKPFKVTFIGLMR